MSAAVAERTRCKQEGHSWDNQGTYSKCKTCGRVKRNGSPQVAVTRVVPETGEIIERTVPPGHFKPAKDERLTRDFRAKLLACQRPGLIWDGAEEPPAKPGDVIEVGAGVSITVYKIRPTKGGDHRGYYTVDDDRPALPRRVPPMYEPPETDELGYPIAPTAAVIAAATVDGSYTQDPNQAVTGVGPEVDVEYRRVLGVRRRMKQSEQKRRDDPTGEAERDVERLNSELKQLTKRAVKMGVDPVATVAPIQRAIEEAHANLSEQKAAA